MNLPEAAELLTMMAAYDQRTIGEADVIAWQSVLTDASFQDCCEAVRRHYSEHTDRMMPAHVRRIVRDIHHERQVEATATGWAPGQAGVPKEEAAPEVERGSRMALSDLPAAVADLVARVRADLPEGSVDALFPRRTAWQREHAAYVRTRNAAPNPLYKPQAAVPVSVQCPLCPATSQSLKGHLADYHPEAVGHYREDGTPIPVQPRAEGPMSACPGVITTWVDQVRRHRDGTVCGHGGDEEIRPTCPVVNGPCPGDERGSICWGPCREAAGLVRR